MLIATRSFTVTGPDGPDTVAVGERFYDVGHELVRRHPENFRPASADEDLREELELRKERIAASTDRKHEPQSEAGRRQRDEDQFWTRMANEMQPREPNVDEDTRNLETVERYDAAVVRAMTDDALEGWHFGRVE